MFLFLAQREKKGFLVLIIEKHLKTNGMSQILMFDFRFTTLFTINSLCVLQSGHIGVYKSCQMVEFHQQKNMFMKNASTLLPTLVVHCVQDLTNFPFMLVCSCCHWTISFHGVSPNYYEVSLRLLTHECLNLECTLFYVVNIMQGWGLDPWCFKCKSSLLNVPSFFTNWTRPLPQRNTSLPYSMIIILFYFMEH